MNRGRNQGWGVRSTAAKAPVKPGSQRKVWVRAATEAMALTPEPRGGFLRGVVRELKIEGFPVEAGQSGRLLAESFLKACDAFEIATGYRRDSYARAVVALAGALDGVLADVRASAADAIRARTGERD